MLKARFLDVTYTHTEGMETCIVPPGLHFPAGATLLEKRRLLEGEGRLAWLRTSLLNEPRGHVAMYGAFLTAPSGEGYDAGVIWSDGERCNDMCGHGTIALGMAMVSLGLAPESGDDAHTTIRFETTAGPVSAEVRSNPHRVEWTRFENVPAYVAEREVPITLPGHGELKADIAFGGNYFAIVDWAGRGRKIGPENGAYFRELGHLVRRQVAEKVRLRHPLHAHIRYPSPDTDLLVTFWHESERARYRNVHVLSGGLLDRSPGGTGTSAMMAMLEARGALRVGETIHSEGLLGSGTFEGCLVRETRLGNHRAVVPTVKGRAHIVGYAKWLLDPEDPVGRGFVVT